MQAACTLARSRGRAAAPGMRLPFNFRHVASAGLQMFSRAQVTFGELAQAETEVPGAELLLWDESG